jgi:DNA mismatch repair ATPase MutS
MSARNILRPARCRVACLRPAHTSLSFSHHNHRNGKSALTGLTTIFQRGAKRKTTVKLDTLPQGLLPALPKDETDKVPEKSYPPVLQQHLNNVRKFSDCVVLTRVGDFYEMYFDQVDQYAHLVNLKKAKRATALGDVAMAGFQYGQLDRYLKMFVQDLGKQVAISEQIRLPDGERLQKAGAPMYDRKVTRVVTAGTLIDENFMDPYENNYLLSVHIDGVTSDQLKPGQALDQYNRMAKVGLSWIDLSSGDFYTQSGDLSSLASVVARIGPREIVLDSSFEDAGSSTLQRLLGNAGHSIHFQASTSTSESIEDWADMLESPVPQDEQSDFTFSEVAAGSLILEYVRGKLIDTSVKLQPPVRRSPDEYMVIDKQSLRGLEIRQTLKDGLTQGSLLQTMRRTVTKSGARLLSQRLVSPSLSLTIINDRLDLVQELRYRDALREHVQGLLRKTSDTCRLLQRFSIGKGDADDMVGLAKTIVVMQQMIDLLHDHVLSSQASDPALVESDQKTSDPLVELTCFWNLLERFDLIGPMQAATSILSTIDEEGLSRKHQAEVEQTEKSEQMAEDIESADAIGAAPPKLSRKASKLASAASALSMGNGDQDIWIMRKQASPTLSKAHKDLDALLLEKRELSLKLRQETGSESLTLKWSAQLGHFCHLRGKDTKSLLENLSGARSIGSTKSTRTFHFGEWTHLGVSIDTAKLRVRTEEERVFRKLRGHILENLMRLRRNAAVLDELDVACSSATAAKERNLIRPILNSSTAHKIVGGRHPTVDVGLTEQGRQFTANDCFVGDASESIYLITGPNMAGKSTYLRQNALITILAQTGSFVPADFAELGLVDQVFSRVGSADNLYMDQSTFMVEMLETAEILKRATPRSFVIMDEIGRGTTPEDGVAMGYACLHHLQHVNQCRALFATHFHALADMTVDFEGMGRYCTDVAEEGDGSWAYVHKLRKGVNRKSHALKVAQVAGLPEEAIAVAGDVLRELERARLAKG